ncbi:MULTISPECIES: Fic family protein [Methanoculleus]|jgi:Fic family protein|uniref:Filamentation induced by cAMP protein Fic n=2 Tax=Methanoculleus TaxID=45989 RepID=A3CXE1_METMJ|nr:MULTISPECIES: Fic family protein [Methanoculleus]ABN58041.1 filamentation induced by cAMP protein Fic [Methanoculleus marisnigri JR1]UYU19425.1 Fic family protein [Methanoculleus submarinus]
MKPPRTPEYSPADVKKAWEHADTRDVIDAVFNYNKRYLHWEELKWRDLPVDPLYVWILMKAFRERDMKYVSFDDLRLKYNLLDDFLENLHFLDRSAAEIISSGLDSRPQDRNRFITNSLMEEAIASSQIEGAAVTRTIAKKMLREQRKPATKDERMILNNYITMKRITQVKDEDLTPELILEIHKTITRDTLEDPNDEGRFRDNNEIRVFDMRGNVLHTPPDFALIEGLIEELCAFANNDDGQFIHPVIKGIILHFLIGYIHPFNDGNGRTARSIFYWYMLRKDYWLFEYMAVSRAIKDAEGQYKLAYLYTESDENDLTYFIRYNLAAVKTAVDNIRKYIEKKQGESKQTLTILQKNEGLSLRQAEIIKSLIKHPDKPITIKEIVETYRVAYGTARSDLFRLEELGYLAKRKSGKEYIFIFRGLKE